MNDTPFPSLLTSVGAFELVEWIEEALCRDESEGSRLCPETRVKVIPLGDEGGLGEGLRGDLAAKADKAAAAS